MNVFQQILEDREERPAEGIAPELLEWLNGGVAPEVRLLRFDKWVDHQLATRLEWGWAGERKARLIEQCRVYLEGFVLDLWRRGWMLDGRRLAAHIEAMLDRIGAYQRKGAVKEFWPYFRVTVDRYVGANAEELRAEAMGAGAHIGQVLAALGAKPAAGPSLPELVAQRKGEVAEAKESKLRDRLARQRAKEDAARRTREEQPELL